MFSCTKHFFLYQTLSPVPNIYSSTKHLLQYQTFSPVPNIFSCTKHFLLCQTWSTVPNMYQDNKHFSCTIGCGGQRVPPRSLAGIFNHWAPVSASIDNWHRRSTPRLNAKLLRSILNFQRNFGFSRTILDSQVFHKKEVKLKNFFLKIFSQKSDAWSYSCIANAFPTFFLLIGKRDAKL